MDNTIGALVWEILPDDQKIECNRKEFSKVILFSDQMSGYVKIR